MSKETIIIKNEKALLEYLYKRLSLGCTDPITESEYFRFINLLEERVNSDTSLEKVSFEQETFSTIVEKAMVILDKSRCNNGKQAILYSDVTGKVFPTYNLTPLEYGEYRMIEQTKQITIARNLMEELTPKVEFSKYEWKKFDSLEAAQKVASFFINDLIDRYIKEMIRLGFWPSEFTNPDRYIFWQNFAQTFDGEGTKEAFINAYIHATRVVSKIKDDTTPKALVRFSNNPNNSLAYANYLKMLLPAQLKFLTDYSHKPYALNDAEINVITEGSQAAYNSIACIYYDENGDWSNTYERNDGIIDEEPVKIMQKRLRNIIDYQ